MSRIGKLPINIPENVKVSVKNGEISVEGPKGSLKRDIVDEIQVEIKDNKVSIIKTKEGKEAFAFHGLMRALINNMVVGVSTGFEKKLEIQGVGYRVTPKGKDIELALGYSHPIPVKAPENIVFKCEGNTNISISGTDKQQVGQVAADIRALRPPEPYKGKGIRYVGEYVRRKAGKTSTA